MSKYVAYCRELERAGRGIAQSRQARRRYEMHLRGLARFEDSWKNE